MRSLVATKNANGAATVRLSDDDLHRAARKGFHEANHAVFGLLPATVAQIIRHRAWKTRGRQFKTFGEYALDQTSDGLGIANDQHLWLLRCSMDVRDNHVKEWADVLEEVEKAVKAYAVESRQTVRSFNGQSLEELAKNVRDVAHGRITYLPSRAGEGYDRNIVSLRRNKPDVFRRVARGELSMAEVRKQIGRQAGMKVPTSVTRAKSLVRSMTAKERREFIEWLKEEGHI